MARALLVALALATSTPGPAPSTPGAAAWPPEVEAVIQTGSGLFLPGATALGYFVGGPRAQARGWWVGAGQLGFDVAVMALFIAGARSGPNTCPGFECVDPGLVGAVAGYVAGNTAYTLWSAFDVYATVKQDPPLGTVGPIR